MVLYVKKIYNTAKNTELKDQMVTVRESKGDRHIQLKDAITSFGNKYLFCII
jgi:hypothetical protein